MNSSMYSEKVYRYKVLQTAVSKFGQSLSKISTDQRVQAEQIARKQLELESRLLASAEARHLVIPGGRTEAAVAEIVARYTSEDEFNQELEANQLDIVNLRQSVNRELMVEAVMDVVALEIPEVSETDASLYYYFHLEKFQRAETRSARHILLTINPDFPENTREQALARISLIAKRLRKNPARFAEQAMKHSECPTSMDGGFLGQLPAGKLFAELDKVLFSLPPGVVSEVVESQLGFHVLLCDVVHPAGMVALDEIVGTIAKKLTQRKRKYHQQQWIRGLFSKHPHAERTATAKASSNVNAELGHYHEEISARA